MKKILKKKILIITHNLIAGGSQKKLINLFNELKDIPIEKYDLIINDFEGITSLACQLKKVPCIQFGHQASFNFNNIKKPKGNFLISDLVSSLISWSLTVFSTVVKMLLNISEVF